MSLPKPLETLLNLDGFIIFIEGKKGKGKTNCAMLINEICKAFNWRHHFATNIETQCYYMKYIANYPELKEWLENEHGKKIFTLDEAGKHIKRMRFMSEQNTQLMDLLQLIRHYDCGFIGVAPSSKFIDTSFTNTDILDARIRKISLENAKIYDYFNDDVYFLHSLPKTSIIHNSKDIAPFSMERKQIFSELSLSCQVAKLYAVGWTFGTIGKRFNITNEEAKRALRKYLAHSQESQITSNHEVGNPIKKDLLP